MPKIKGKKKYIYIYKPHGFDSIKNTVGKVLSLRYRRPSLGSAGHCWALLGTAGPRCPPRSAARGHRCPLSPVVSLRVASFDSVFVFFETSPGWMEEKIAPRPPPWSPLRELSAVPTQQLLQHHLLLLPPPATEGLRRQSGTEGPRCEESAIGCFRFLLGWSVGFACFVVFLPIAASSSSDQGIHQQAGRVNVSATARPRRAPSVPVFSDVSRCTTVMPATAQSHRSRRPLARRRRAPR